MNLKGLKVQAIENQALNESAGICDHCDHCNMENTGGDGIETPIYSELICDVKRIIIEPLPENERLLKCEHFIDNRI